MDDETYFGELNMLFSFSGWKLFKEEIEATATNLDHLNDVKTLEELYFRKGQLAVLNDMLNFETRIAALREQADESNQ